MPHKPYPSPFICNLVCQWQLYLYSYAQSWPTSILIMTPRRFGRFWMFWSSGQLVVNSGITFFSLRQHGMRKLGWSFLLELYIRWPDGMQWANKFFWVFQLSKWLCSPGDIVFSRVPKEVRWRNSGPYCPTEPWFVHWAFSDGSEKSARASCQRSLLRDQGESNILLCQNLTGIHVSRLLFDGPNIFFTLTVHLLSPEKPH